MSLTDNHILPNLYAGLATPPLSPTILHPGREATTRTISAPITPTEPNLDLPSPTHIGQHDIVQVFPPTINDVPTDVSRSLIPTQFKLPPKTPIARYFPANPVQIHPQADSLTREIRKGKMPALNHLLSVGNGKVLALTADEKYVYAGCQSKDNEIVVFSRNSLQPLFRLLGHQGSILALLIVEEKNWLVSSSSAGDIRIWCTNNLEPICIIHACDDTAGDIYSLAWDERNGGTLYFGSQGATIEWINFAPKSSTRRRQPSTGPSSASITVPVLSDGSVDRKSRHAVNLPNVRTGRYRPHTFFDNAPSAVSSGANTPHYSPRGANRKLLTNAELENLQITDAPLDQSVDEMEVPVEDRLSFAHYGYVYALLMVDRPNGDKWLVSGSGDCDVKIWQCHAGGAVLSLGHRDSLLYAGLQTGDINIWDLETGACIRTIDAHKQDVMTISVLGGDVYSGAADGTVIRLNEEFDCTAAFQGHSGIVLSSAIVKSQKEGWELVTAGNDTFVKVWSIAHPQTTSPLRTDFNVEGDDEGDVMLYALSRLIAVPTVSDEEHRESCRQGAHLLKRILTQLGATTEMLPGEQGKNPLLLATFSATSTNVTSTTPGQLRKRVLFYGHYDVQPAAESEWETNPWELSGRNGFLYGRGVSDNKGPILAVACAAAGLRRNRDLDVDVVMLIEGEEEAGSRGFAETVRKNKESIGHIDSILLSNSTWIGEDHPCVVYGMRGVVYANISISSTGVDAHSGVDGGMVAEPMMDMVRVLGALASAGNVQIPGFYNDVRPRSEAETQLLSQVAQSCRRPIEDLVKTWRQPSFSIANIVSSGSTNKTVIPKKVCADISMRLVPDQDLAEIVWALTRFCQETFEALQSGNRFEINVTHTASWWVASLDNPYFQALESAVQEIWKKPPLKIREGGTVPTISFLEKEFGAPCVHLPLGQASDAGHLANERMRLINLRNGRRVVERYLSKIAKI